jgi:hypothetical protein
MLKLNSNNISFTGSSSIEDVVVANMNASYSGGTEIYTGMNIVNIIAYSEHKEIVDADFAQFCNEVAEIAALIAPKNEIVE